MGEPGPKFEARPPVGPLAYDHPDTECDGWSTPLVTLRFASVRGAKHRYYRQPRQDAARAAVHEPTGSTVFAVADGVSSAVQAELGAAEACRTAVSRMLDLLTEQPGPLDLEDVAHHAADRLRELATCDMSGREPQLGEVADRYATTLVFGVAYADPEGHAVDIGRIGDSGAWVLDLASGTYQALFESKTGSDSAVVSNEVHPLPQVPDPLPTVGIRPVPGQAVLIATDGFGDPLGDGDGAVGALFTRNLGAPEYPSPPWLAHLLDFSKETFDDDRTLLAIWPSGEAAAR
ncbi:protein phosphatase 2C domain-containing protein [Streptomyces sp. DSM 44915]|uniref:Protein phosphatase 2C domain-containing protein n=1 Tax=Streptomyces chisholmiae TaxID=3075540 RepID=A0ABU2JUL8_9ACTN|nr:protein phosphatase 2C domain-containing protein [Streptomyces sp. DSM 44915]MDT0268667.1 protein phosphatase 2C domain-containing protein [Streptomyces sp. DSM 44915]